MQQHSTATIVSTFRHGSVLVFFVALFMLSSCASNDSGGYSAERSAGKITACRSGDQMVDSERQCLQDDAACYQISNGKFCTGERGNVCPAGSTALPAGAACPSGARCIAYGESLNCAIQYRQ